jgi:hypothetical protein
MDLGPQGRVAIVAAASKGLGRAVAPQLARFLADIEVRLARPDICFTISRVPPSKTFAGADTEDCRSTVDHLPRSTVFFASERASYTNGASVAIDGGAVRSLL